MKKILKKQASPKNPKKGNANAGKSTLNPPFAAVTNYPSPMAAAPMPMSNQAKIDFIEVRFREIMQVLGLDLTNPSLSKTPNRIAQMYVEEIFSGLDLSKFPKISFVDDDCDFEKHRNIIMVKVSFTSFCEHHFVPMEGYAYVAYIPKDKLIGLSKIPRIVRFFARRPQLQERLTAQIADSLSILLETEDVAVSIQATHHCVMARGIEDRHSYTTSNVLRGTFMSESSAKHEFFEAINRNVSM